MPYLGLVGLSAVMVVLVVCVTAVLLAGASPLRLVQESSGIVKLEKREGGTVFVDVYPDVAVLGETYGHELRRWVMAGPDVPSLRIHSLVTKNLVGDGNGAAVIFGRQWEGVALSRRRVWLIHPTGNPPEHVDGVAEGSSVVLAGIDPTGGRYAWAAWAQARAVEVKVNEGLAADVRLRWPEVMAGFGR